ncbi:MAG: CRTAC1 family protein [Cyclobacteriaceae bacterium]
MPCYHQVLSYISSSLWGISLLLLAACSPSAEEKSHQAMLQLLRETQQVVAQPDNIFANDTRVHYFDSLIRLHPDQYGYYYQRALDLLRRGDSEQAAREFSALQTLRGQGKLDGFLNPKEQQSLDAYVGLSYLRRGEQENCILNHTATSCLFPIQSAGFHQLTDGSEQAIDEYTKILEENPDDLSTRWLLNVAYMTLGQYPDGVPEDWLIPESAFQSEFPLKHFPDIASTIGFDTRSLSGGLVVDDFTNDGYLDIMISEWGQDDQLRLYVNNADGTFAEKTQEANLIGLYGGLNMVQADYNNDGWLDVLVLRGAWLQEYGQHPNSLLKNNGDGTFTDVTYAAGLLSFHPTQTATWNDFNRDGWLDLFIGNETAGAQSFHPCELYLNNQDGTFREVAQEAGVAVSKEGFRIPPIYIKGVTSGDFNNDGWPDLYVSTGGGTALHTNYLFQNLGVNQSGQLTFSDATENAGLGGENSTFTTWFWDYNHDGWLDIFAAGYWKGRDGVITEDIAAEFLSLPHDAQTGLLYRNNGNGTFTDVSQEVHLSRILYSMGANFGDLDNDGWLDMYLGTGDPTLSSIIPNRMFRNSEGKYFQDVTTSAGVGHLQKGHAVSFSDIDNDGDQDLLMSMGGAYQGDVYQNAFFENPYQDENHWLTLILQGTTSNRSAIGARVVITVDDQGLERKIYREVNSGGSFGASTLRLEIGLGKADLVETLEIQWPNTPSQFFQHIQANQFYRITEGENQIHPVTLARLQFSNNIHSHASAK